MNSIEISILGAVLLALLSANTLASRRIKRDWGSQGVPYHCLVWLVPVMGALFILAHIPARPRSPYPPLQGNTLAVNEHPTTLKIHS